ncbi:MAG: methionyl-tRNA formyltransferase [Bacteroidia bacterium]|nr:methionyl-tRNA formyltransferase [Bacteroidia bacterium]
MSCVFRAYQTVFFSELRSDLSTTSLRIVFFGTPEFAAHSLKLIAATGHHIVAVVTAADKPAGRGMKIQESDVKKAALQLGLPILQPTNLKSEEFQQTLRELNADLGIVIAFRMLPEAVWSMPKMGTFNLHASLLPKYRGAAPINHAIIQGEQETGVTTFFLKHEIDTGDIVKQEAVSIGEQETAGELHDKLMAVGGKLVVATLEEVATGKWHTQPQNASETDPIAPKLSRAYCEIFHNDTAKTTFNKIRGLSPYPGAWGETAFGTLKIYKTLITDRKSGFEGAYRDNNKLYWPCKDFDLEILELQAAGKPRMKTIDFINGLANKG